MNALNSCPVLKIRLLSRVTFVSEALSYLQLKKLHKGESVRAELSNSPTTIGSPGGKKRGRQGRWEEEERKSRREGTDYRDTEG